MRYATGTGTRGTDSGLAADLSALDVLGTLVRSAKGCAKDGEAGVITSTTDPSVPAELKSLVEANGWTVKGSLMAQSYDGELIGAHNLYVIDDNEPPTRPGERMLNKIVELNSEGTGNAVAVVETLETPNSSEIHYDVVNADGETLYELNDE